MAYNFIKRSVDIILSIFLLITLLPLLLIISIIIMVSTGGPIIFSQERVGLNGNKFILFKFKTMAGSGSLWTDKNDLRVTSFGKILRRIHLDELPQLINILKNDMSFIGPRPERSELALIYKQLPNYAKRHDVKPGLSGLAQLYYKPSTSIEEAGEKLKYDIYYIENRSTYLDITIFIKTVIYWIKGKI